MAPQRVSEHSDLPRTRTDPPLCLPSTRLLESPREDCNHTPTPCRRRLAALLFSPALPVHAGCLHRCVAIVYEVRRTQTLSRQHPRGTHPERDPSLQTLLAAASPPCSSHLLSLCMQVAFTVAVASSSRTRCGADPHTLPAASPRHAPRARPKPQTLPHQWVARQHDLGTGRARLEAAAWRHPRPALSASSACAYSIIV